MNTGQQKRKNLSLRKSGLGDDSASKSTENDVTPSSFQPSLNKPSSSTSFAAKKSNGANQMRMTSFFSKPSPPSASLASAAITLATPSPAGAGIKSFLQQKPKPVAQVAPLAGSSKNKRDSGELIAKNKAMNMSSASDMFVDLDDYEDEDFDWTTSVKYTPKVNKSPKKEQTGLDNGEKHGETGSGKKRKRQMLSTDDEDAGLQHSQDSNAPGKSLAAAVQSSRPVAATMQLFTQDSDSNASSEGLPVVMQGQCMLDDEDWDYLDIPAASPPPQHILDQELINSDIDEFETQDIGAELALADGLVQCHKEPEISKILETPTKPPAKRPKQEIAPVSSHSSRPRQESVAEVGKQAFRPAQLQKCDAVKPLVKPALTPTPQGQNKPEISSQVVEDIQGLLNKQDELLDSICSLLGGIKLEHLLSIPGLDFQKIPAILARRESLKTEFTKVTAAVQELKQSTKSEPKTVTRKPLFKSPLSATLSHNLQHPRRASLNHQSPQPGPTSPTGEGDFDLPPCGDSFFDDQDELPSTLASFVKTTSVKSSPVTPNFGEKSSPKFSFKKPGIPETVNTNNNSSTSPRNFNSIMPLQNVKNSSSNFANNTTSNVAPFRFDYNISEPSTNSSEDITDGFEDPFTGSMVAEVAANERTYMSSQSKSKSAFVTPVKSTPVVTPSKTGYSPSGTVHRRSQIRDDSSSGQFDGRNFPHSAEMMKVFRDVFGLRDFRTNQLQAINAALLGNDCFILMPTGGGKSLCYQLPALVTPGVTVVVSPLRSLIQDQTQRLCSLNVAAAHLSGEPSVDEVKAVYNKLYQQTPGITLLYVTPEKICASEKFISVLQHLYQREKLMRFVIDEAHCVSQWGHDFRPDYKKLNMLRQKFPGVPMMAVTATATPRVRKDILHQLGMKDCKWFSQSFNRPNLKFMVKPKRSKNLTKDLIELILNEFNRKSGIVYCLSRHECDQTAKDLRAAGILAESYHAGLTDNQRNTIQERWLNERNCKIVCATIAFGMGIDKPDVRFVVHYSLPKSVEGYYQECGRAGRDGRLATCILYYAYGDVTRLRRIIEMDPSANYEAKKVHLDNLYRMVQYGENCVECRRSQMLDYFGESFDRRRCADMPDALCDNCMSKDVYTTEDITEEVKEIIKGVEQVTGSGRFTNNYTLLHFIEIYKGSKNAKIVDNGHDKIALHGRAKKNNYLRTDIERLFRHLVVEGVIAEQLHITAQEHTVCYVKLGTRANDVRNGRLKIKFQFQRKGGKAALEGAKSSAEQSPTDIAKNRCYEELVELAKEISHEYNYKSYNMVFSSDTLTEMSQRLPITPDEMKAIAGVGQIRMQNYGDRFLSITINYAAIVASLDAMQESEDFAEVMQDDATCLDDEDDNEPQDLLGGSRYFHEPSVIGGSGSKRGRGGKKFGGRKKAYSRGKGKKRGTSKTNNYGGWPPKKESGSSSFGETSYNKKFSSSRGTRGRGRASSTATSSSSSSFTARKPGIMGAPKTSRSFLTGGGAFLG